MKNTAYQTLRAGVVALLLVLVAPITMAQNFLIDTSNTSTSPMTGLWGNANEPGWGTAITQQYGTIFVSMYTFDGKGNPFWYIASSCAVKGNGCTGSLYKVTGGSAITVAWAPSDLRVSPVGTVNLTFSDVNTGLLSFTIDGISSSKAISRFVFENPPPLTPVFQNVTIVSNNGTVSPSAAIEQTLSIDSNTIQYSAAKTQTGAVIEAWTKPIKASDYLAVKNMIVDDNYFQGAGVAVTGCGVGGPAYTFKITKDNSLQTLQFLCGQASWPTGVSDFINLEQALIVKYRAL